MNLNVQDVNGMTHFDKKNTWLLDTLEYTTPNRAKKRSTEACNEDILLFTTCGCCRTEQIFEYSSI